MKCLSYLWILLLAPAFTSCNSPSSRDSIPNILLILVDDMGYGDLSSAGNPHIKSPHLDRLAADGVSLSHFYVSPVCAPTRASLLTGKYHQKVGVTSVTNGYESIQTPQETLASILKDHGYQTAIYGKWHIGEYFPAHPNAMGFDQFLGFRTGHTEDYDDATLEFNGSSIQTKGYITDMLTDAAITFMKEADSPFFCYLPYNAPHTPLQIDTASFQHFIQKGLDERTSRIYAMIENIDDNIGRLRAFLKDHGLEENTILIFLSDNGPISGWRLAQEKMRYNAGLRDQKFTIFEGGIRTQNFWLWPGKWEGGNLYDGIGAHIDIVPTLLNAINIPVPSSMDGIALGPSLEGVEDQQLLQRTYFEQYSLETLQSFAPLPGGIARRGPWKWVNDTALYHLQQDPGESKNLIFDEASIFKDLRTAYFEWWESIYDSTLLAPAPIAVGLPEENPLYVKAHHSVKTGALEFTGRRGNYGERIATHPRGVDGDWVSNWHKEGEKLQWQLDIKKAGTYELSVVVKGDYKGFGPRMSISIGNQQQIIELPGSIENAVNWKEIPAGTIQLPAGLTHMDLRLEEDFEGVLDLLYLGLQAI